jgi:hypothetical protein
MSTFRKPERPLRSRRHRRVGSRAAQKPRTRPGYRDLTWMTEEQLLNTEGLQAVAVEVSSADDRIMDITGQCIEAGMHVHLDKPGGESFSAFKKVLDEAGRRKLAVQLGYMYRNNPAVQFCQRVVGDGLARAGLRGPRRDERHAPRCLPEVPVAVSRRNDVHLRLPPDRSGREPDGKTRSNRCLPAANAVGCGRRDVRQRADRVRVPESDGHDPHGVARGRGLSAAAIGRLRRRRNG